MKKLLICLLFLLPVISCSNVQYVKDGKEMERIIRKRMGNKKGTCILHDCKEVMTIENKTWPECLQLQLKILDKIKKFGCNRGPTI
jgi:hypothetical protein